MSTQPEHDHLEPTDAELHAALAYCRPAHGRLTLHDLPALVALARTTHGPAWPTTATAGDLDQVAAAVLELRVSLAPPCPTWCTHPGGPGHPFEEWHDSLERHHVRTLDAGRVHVELVQLEHAASHAGPTTSDRPGAQLLIDGNTTSDQLHDAASLRQAARAMLEAADHLDRIAAQRERQD